MCEEGKCCVLFYHCTYALRGKNSTKDWRTVERNFNQTLHSIFQQTPENFEVYVACNDLPQLTENYGDRLHIRTVQTQTPRGWLECCRDRAWKQLVSANEVYRQHKEILDTGEGIFVFPVDADDYISNRIVAYAEKHPQENGFKSETGYRLVEGQRQMEITPYYGGSMNIMKLFKEDLPTELPDSTLSFDKETCIRLNERYPVRWNDIEVAEKFANMGRPFHELPFRTTIYVVGTGANISEDDPAHGNAKTRKVHWGVLLRKISLINKKILSKDIKAEFGMD